MSKGKKLLIFAIVLVVLAGAFAAISALQDRGVIPGGESSVEEESSQWSSTAVNFFEDREAMDVASIEVKNKAVTYTLVSSIEKATDSSGTETTRQIWKMKEHEGWTLSDSSINNIVSIGTTLKRVAVMSESREGVDLANFGLANPLAEIRIDYTDGATVTVYVGDMTPDGIYRYAYLSDRDGVFTIYKSTATYAEYDLATLRSLTIPGIDVEEELTHLMLQKKGERKIELVRYEDDEVNEYVYDSSNMKMVSPYNWTTAVVTGNLNEMFSKMEGVSVKSLVDPDATDLAKYGLSEEDPEYHVFVETREAIKTKDADGNVVTTSYEYHPTDYYFGTVVEGDETMRYFRTGDSNDVYTVSAGSVSCFDFTPINYLSHLIFIYEISKLDSFAVTGVPAGETKTQTFTGSILRQNEEEAD
ncbi:MAG: DUF4340 domain-containing protein, partial [Clostridiales bacterium]|nr:DUF4340 domain-containing protein [Clostridiales bacterium]